MLGKSSRHHVSMHLNKAKNIMGQAIHHTKNFLNNFDSGVNTFKNIYKVAAPILESYGVPTGHKYINSALSGYDMIKNNVMENQDRISNDLNRVKDSLGKKMLSLTFHNY